MKNISRMGAWMNHTAVLAIIFTSFFSTQASAVLTPIKYFAESVKFTQVKISPNGQYLAVTAPVNDQTVLVTMTTEGMEPIEMIRFGSSYHINQFHWANNERIVFTKSIKRGTHAREANYGQIYAANFDGSKFESLFGYDVAYKQIGTHINKSHKANRAWGSVETLLKNNPKNIIISARRWDSKLDAPIDIYKLNIYTGKKKRIGRTPIGNGNVYINDAGKLELMSGLTRQGIYTVFRHVNNKWEALSFGEGQPQMINFYKGAIFGSVYTKAILHESIEAIYKYDIENASYEMMYRYNEVEPTVLLHPISGVAFGVATNDGKLNYHYFDRNSSWSLKHRLLRKSFPEHTIDIVSATDDEKLAIVLIRNDKDAGTYYIYDSEQSHLRFLESRRPSINPKDMMAKEAIKYTSRDGATIRGFLTRPLTAGGNKFPMVVLVHGGPFGVQDTWTFDTEVQLLASRGYGVLQINYRGSGGYGQQYENAGNQKMGTLIQQDIIDGTRWAVSTYNLNSNKICIMGTSFGGYSALMAPTIEPTVFSCAIAISGVYDWVAQNKDADYVKIESVKNILKEIQGNEQLLKEHSPIHRLDQFNIPLLLVHGGQDQRTTPEQFDQLSKALLKKNADFETLFKKKEGHGFFDPNNRLELYTRVLAFIDKHIGTQ